MPEGSSPGLFWTSLFLVIAGALIALGATAVVATRAIRARDLLAEKRQAGGDALRAEEKARNLIMTQARAVSEHEYGRGPLPSPLPSDEDTEEKVKAKYLALFEQATGRKHVSYLDGMMAPEVTGLAIAQEQIAELRLPAVLVAVGVVLSMVGSIVSLWA